MIVDKSHHFKYIQANYCKNKFTEFLYILLIWVQGELSQIAITQINNVYLLFRKTEDLNQFMLINKNRLICE